MNRREFTAAVLAMLGYKPSERLIEHYDLAKPGSERSTTVVRYHDGEYIGYDRYGTPLAGASDAEQARRLADLIIEDIARRDRLRPGIAWAGMRKL